MLNYQRVKTGGSRCISQPRSRREGPGAFFPKRCQTQTLLVTKHPAFEALIDLARPGLRLDLKIMQIYMVPIQFMSVSVHPYSQNISKYEIFSNMDPLYHVAGKLDLQLQLAPMQNSEH
jgi:hypothetical protein